jgi:hypothetical protein
MANDVGTTHDTTDDTPDNGARRTGNDSAGARADRDAFQRSGLRYHRHRCERQCEQAHLERRMHEKTFGLTSIAVSKNHGRRLKNTAIYEELL